MTHLFAKANLFFMKTIFTDSYKTTEEYYGVIFAKLSEFKNQIFFMNLLQIGIFTLYTLINQLYKFQRNQTSSFHIAKL